MRPAMGRRVATPSPSYEPRRPAQQVLHQIVLAHFETFRAQAASLRDGEGLPRFVEREFREFLTCGCLAAGFARFYERWNISLFHYRNHGADFGRVLAGFEVPPGEGSAFEAFLSGLGYEFHLEEDNDAYRRFLGHQPSGIGS